MHTKNLLINIQIYTHRVYATPIPKNTSSFNHSSTTSLSSIARFKAPNMAFDISSSTVVGHRGNGWEIPSASLSLLSGLPRCHPCYDERQVANCYLVVSRRVYITRFHFFHMYMKYMNMSIFPPGCLSKKKQKQVYEKLSSQPTGSSPREVSSWPTRPWRLSEAKKAKHVRRFQLFHVFSSLTGC